VEREMSHRGRAAALVLLLSLIAGVGGCVTSPEPEPAEEARDKPVAAAPQERPERRSTLAEPQESSELTLEELEKRYEDPAYAERRMDELLARRDADAEPKAAVEPRRDAGREQTQERVAEGSHYRYDGWIVGVGGLLGIEDFDVPGDLDDVDLGDTWGAEARLSYRWNDYLATEVLFQYFDGFDVDAAGVSEDLTLDGWFASFNLKGYAPIWHVVQPYALVGGGYLDGGTIEVVNQVPNETDESDLALRFGLGIEAYLGDWWILALEGAYVKPYDDLEDYPFYTVSLGLQYRF
jgi:opacity protein-like surface antigen